MGSKIYVIGVAAAFLFLAFWLLITIPIWFPVLLFSSPLLIALYFVVKHTFLKDHVNDFYLRAYDWLVYRSEKPRTLLWQGFYEIMSWVNQDDDWVTMNYGYALLSDDGKLLSDLTEEQDRREVFSIQLYYYTASVLPEVNKMNGKTLVEVGSGRGGGLSFLTRHLQPEKSIGIDFSHNQVEFCQRRHADQKAIAFHQGNAETIAEHPALAPNSVNYLVNVESSHCYGNIENFFNGINTVLKEDGLFLYTDFRAPEEMDKLNELLKEHFTVVNAENISKNVMHALKLDTERRNSVIEEKCPKVFVPLIRKFSGVEGSRVFEELDEEKTVYWAWTLRKKN